MELTNLLLDVPKMAADDYVGFTFFIGYMAMMAASVFFFFERGNVDGKWKTSLLVSGLITFIAAVHYYYMRDYYMAHGESTEIPDFRPVPAARIKVGMKVLHKRFGKGQVKNIEGSDSRIATIMFNEIGEKRIMLKFAKLGIDES